MRVAFAALLASGALVLAAGCSSTEQSVKKDDLAKKTQSEFDQIARRNGQRRFPKITCPDDLKAEKGAKTRCSATGTDGTLGITVTVSSVKDGKTQLRFKGDSKLSK